MSEDTVSTVSKGKTTGDYEERKGRSETGSERTTVLLIPRRKRKETPFRFVDFTLTAQTIPVWIATLCENLKCYKMLQKQKHRQEDQFYPTTGTWDQRLALQIGTNAVDFHFLSSFILWCYSVGTLWSPLSRPSKDFTWDLKLMNQRIFTFIYFIKNFVSNAMTVYNMHFLFLFLHNLNTLAAHHIVSNEPMTFV